MKTNTTMSMRDLQVETIKLTTNFIP